MSSDALQIPILEGCGELKIGIVTTLWNKGLVSMLQESAEQYFSDCGIQTIVHAEVVGAWELVQASKKLQRSCNGVLALGTVIKGDTYHFELIAESATQGLMQLNLQSNVPVTMHSAKTPHKTKAKKSKSPIAPKG